MAEIPNEIVKIIRNFLAEAEKDNIRILKAVLFGSYANGNWNKYSDIDLALVSEDFQGSPFYDSKRLFKSVLKSSTDIETHPFLPEEFNESNPFVYEILRTGIPIV